MGYKVIFIPTAKFWHKVSSTTGEASPFHIYFLWRNQLRNIIKFTNVLNMLRMFLFSMIYSSLIGIGFYGLFEKKPYLMFYIIKAYLKILYEMKKLVKERSIYQQLRKIDDNLLKSKGIIMSLSESFKEEMSAFIRRRLFKTLCFRRDEKY